MDFLFHILIFIIILFLYIHINNQYKRSEDLEIYEMDYVDNLQLQDVCNLKQPILFNYNTVNPEFVENINPDILENYGNYDVNVKEINDYWNPDINSVDYTILPYQTANTLLSSDINSKYFMENNQTYLEETGLIKQFELNDDLLKPPLTIQTSYDIQMGAKQTVTPLRYHTNYRQFICVNSGKISIKLTPWKSRKYLYPYKDYETYEFKSPINVWKPQHKYINEMDKIKWLDIDVLPGYMIFIPSYWWYSIKYSDEPNNCLTTFTYNNVMNIISNIRDIGLYYLQQSNIKPRIIKPIPELSDDIIVNDDDKKELDDSITDDNNHIVTDLSTSL
jgi:hypothetical protein